MSQAKVRIYRTANPAGWAWTFDRTDLKNDAIDNVGTAANPNAAMDAVKPLIGGLPGSLAEVDIVAKSFEPEA